MRLHLKQHPDTPCEAVRSIVVDAIRHAADLELRYLLEGDLEKILFPPSDKSAPKDGLWEHTCFEAFVRFSGDAYFEFNLSPSSAWAAYLFAGYRSDAEKIPYAHVPIHQTFDGELYVFEARLHLGVAGLALASPWQVGLSAVIEDVNGRKSYWALAHAPGKPDFHHSDAFVLDLPPSDSQ